MESPAAQYVRNDGFVTRVVGSETVIVPIRSSVGDLDSVYTLSEVATVIWEAIAAPRGMDEIVRTLCERFDVTEETALEDAGEFLASLVEAGLVKRMGERT